MSDWRMKHKTEKKSEQILSSLEREKGGISSKTLRAKAKEYINEAEQHGVFFIVGHDKDTNLYAISVKGEVGQVRCSLKRLPVMIHGLYVMGAKVREMFLNWQM